MALLGAGPRRSAAGCGGSFTGAAALICRAGGGQPVAAADDHRVERWAARCSASRVRKRDGVAGRRLRDWSAAIWRICWTPRRCSSDGLWPLWDRRRRTFADLLLRTEVH